MHASSSRPRSPGNVGAKPSALRQQAVLLPVALLLGAVSFTGCASLEMGRIKQEIARDLERQPDVEVGRGSSRSFGRGTIGTGRFLGRLLAPTSTETFRRLARHVRQLKLGTYPIEGDIDPLAMPRPEAVDRYEAEGWYRAMAVRDSSSLVYVLVREDADDTITDLLAITLEDQELVIARVRGNLSELAVDAIAEGGASGWFDAVETVPELIGVPEEEPEPDPVET